MVDYRHEMSDISTGFNLQLSPAAGWVTLSGA
jgi:hypothetical protein